jgi:hypothetical protein
MVRPPKRKALMRKVLTLVAIAAAALSMSASAFAGGGYGSQPGYDQAACQAQSVGAFGAFGPDGSQPTFGDDVLGSAPGGATGEANSNAAHACNA